MTLPVGSHFGDSVGSTERIALRSARRDIAYEAQRVGCHHQSGSVHARDVRGSKPYTNLIVPNLDWVLPEFAAPYRRIRNLEGVIHVNVEATVVCGDPSIQGFDLRVVEKVGLNCDTDSTRRVDQLGCRVDRERPLAA